MCRERQARGAPLNVVALRHYLRVLGIRTPQELARVDPALYEVVVGEGDAADVWALMYADWDGRIGEGV
ncbi:hypothetical protein NOR53_2866 [gamma proteobacterium NOR5-3]|nr:hypothetical protein NOR53_2866 [gamma proteobacterium NOR5-3]